MFIEKEKLALLVIDMQNAFLSPESPIIKNRGEDNAKYLSIIPNINELANVCRNHDIPVIWVRHAYLKDYADGGIMINELFPQDREDQIWLDGTFSAEIYKEMEQKEGDFHIRKARYSAFYATNLEQLLRNMGVNSLIITGIHTNCCCESTTRDAQFRDFRVYFTSDGTATSEEDLHQATLTNVSINFGRVKTVAEMIKHIEEDY